jgi:hypothetical protein
MRVLLNEWQSIGESVVNIENKNSTLNIYREHNSIKNVEDVYETIKHTNDKILETHCRIDDIFIKHSGVFVVTSDYVQSEICEFI